MNSSLNLVASKPFGVAGLEVFELPQGFAGVSLNACERIAGRHGSLGDESLQKEALRSEHTVDEVSLSFVHISSLSVGGISPTVAEAGGVTSLARGGRA